MVPSSQSSFHQGVSKYIILLLTEDKSLVVFLASLPALFFCLEGWVCFSWQRWGFLSDHSGASPHCEPSVEKKQSGCFNTLQIVTCLCCLISCPWISHSVIINTARKKTGFLFIFPLCKFNSDISNSKEVFLKNVLGFYFTPWEIHYLLQNFPPNPHKFPSLKWMQTVTATAKACPPSPHPFFHPPHLLF